MRRLYRVGTPRGLRGLATMSAALTDRTATAVSPDSSPIPLPYRPSGPVRAAFAPLLPAIQAETPAAGINFGPLGVDSLHKAATVSWSSGTTVPS